MALRYAAMLSALMFLGGCSTISSMWEDDAKSGNPCAMKHNPCSMKHNPCGDY